MPLRGRQYSNFHYPDLQGHLSTRIVEIKDLLLDVDNPRLIGEVKTPNHDPHGKGWQWDCPRCQELLRRALVYSGGTEYNTEAQSLMDSIASIGFLPMDRIVVHEREPGKYVVLEGNRRTACMRTLLHDMRFGNERGLPEGIVDTIKQFEVLVLDSDDLDKDTFLLQAVRHISGIKPWGPYQQASMVYNCVHEKGLSFKETAEAVGLTPTRASSMFHAYLGVKQMEDHPSFGKRATPSHYSHFDQAYKQLPVREWLNWDKETQKYANVGNFAKFCELILDGNQATGQRCVTAVEVRDLLPKVLEENEAREAFLSGRLSIVQAAATVPEIPNPSLVLRNYVGKVGQALDDLPEGFLFSKEGRHDLKQVSELNDRLEKLLLRFAKKQAMAA